METDSEASRNLVCKVEFIWVILWARYFRFQIISRLLFVVFSVVCALLCSWM